MRVLLIELLFLEVPKVCVFMRSLLAASSICYAAYAAALIFFSLYKLLFVDSHYCLFEFDEKVLYLLLLLLETFASGVGLTADLLFVE